MLWLLFYNPDYSKELEAPLTNQKGHFTFSELSGKFEESGL
jgi:hypothetical protein